MKKIRNIKDLENEKLKLWVKQLELEEHLDRSWKGIKNDLSMNKAEGQKQPMATFSFKTGNTLLNGALNYGSNFLTNRLGIIAGRSAENAAEEILGRLSRKINSLVSKKKG